MYSPKIQEDLIPTLYKLGKALGKPMTRIVDEILRDYLNGTKIIKHSESETSTESFHIIYRNQPHAPQIK
jgi:hypothetical protein